MSIKAFVNGNEVIIGGPGGESLPLGTIVDIDSEEIPEGWEKVNEESVDEQISGLTPHTYYYNITDNIYPRTRCYNTL